MSQTTPTTGPLVRALNHVTDVRDEDDTQAHIGALENALSAALDLVEYHAVPHEQLPDFSEHRMGALA